MKSRKLPNLVFLLRRYIGLVVGLLLIVIGLISSVLVCQKEADYFLLHLQIEKIVPQSDRDFEEGGDPVGSKVTCSWIISSIQLGLGELQIGIENLLSTPNILVVWLILLTMQPQAES
jgi:hypothetical protein